MSTSNNTETGDIGQDDIQFSNFSAAAVRPPTPRASNRNFSKSSQIFKESIKKRAASESRNEIMDLETSLPLTIRTSSTSPSSERSFLCPLMLFRNFTRVKNNQIQPEQVAKPLTPR